MPTCAASMCFARRAAREAAEARTACTCAAGEEVIVPCVKTSRPFQDIGGEVSSPSPRTRVRVPKRSPETKSSTLGQCIPQPATSARGGNDARARWRNPIDEHGLVLFRDGTLAIGSDAVCGVYADVTVDDYVDNRTVCTTHPCAPDEATCLAADGLNVAATGRCTLRAALALSKPGLINVTRPGGDVAGWPGKPVRIKLAGRYKLNSTIHVNEKSQRGQVVSDDFPVEIVGVQAAAVGALVSFYE